MSNYQYSLTSDESLGRSSGKASASGTSESSYIQRLFYASENNNMKARRKKAVSRSRWYDMVLFVRKRILVRECMLYQNRKNARLDEYANTAVDNLVGAIKFGASENTFNETTKSTFDPMKWYKVPNEVPKVDELAEEAGDAFARNFDFRGSLNVVGSKVLETVPSLDTYHCTRGKSRTIGAYAGIVGDVVASGSFGPCVPDLNETVRPLTSLSKGAAVVHEVSDPDTLVSAASLAAVSPFRFHSAVPVLSGECRKTFKSLSRMAYPRWDFEQALDANRALTLDEAQLDNDIKTAMSRIKSGKPAISRNEKRRTIKEIMKNAGTENSTNLLDYSLKSIKASGKSNSESFSASGSVSSRSRPAKKAYFYDLSSILGSLDKKLMKLISPIPGIVAKTQCFHAEAMWDELKSPFIEVGKRISRDISQFTVVENLDFVQKEIQVSLAEFVGSSVGVDGIVEEFLEFGLESAENLAYTAVANLAFGNVRTLVPFIFGTATARRRKKEDGGSHVPAN